jgi:hypothetical protein
MSLLRTTRSRVLLLLAGVSFATLPIEADAAVEHPTNDGVGVGVARQDDGGLRLALDAGPAPQGIGPFERFGLWDSAPRQIPTAFRSVVAHYHAEAPAGTERYVGVRASVDGQRWGEWEWDVADGASIRYDGDERWLQHRVVLLGTAERTPMVSAVELKPIPGPRSRQFTGKQATEAPTYRLRVTRQGQVGGRTANGQIVKPRDFFVSLPSWKALSSKGGNEYQVRLSANGRSIVVPVADVGPWNRNDNYWDLARARYSDLPTGWPQDHAAFFENYNGRRAEKGWVRFPSAVDIADGAYWALGLKGVQATVDVTFLWLGDDPGPGPQPRNSSPSQRPEVVLGNRE